MTIAGHGARAVVIGLLVNIFEKKREAQNPFFSVVEVTDDTTDPEVWGRNFPLQYDQYEKTVDQVRTRNGGSEGVPHTPTQADLAILLLSDKGATLVGAPLATEVPAEGDRLIAMGAADNAIEVTGVIVSRVSGELFTRASRRTIDSRFWGGPLFDEQGRLVGILLASVSGTKAVSARVIQRVLDRRGLSGGPSGPR